MAMVCTQVTEWIEQEVSKPIEDWEERTQKKCKEGKWYDPRKWLCWFVRYLVLVIRLVVVTVVTAVITLVCNLVADFLSLLWDALKFWGNLVKALFTWDKCTLQTALGNGADYFIRLFEMPGNVITRPIIDRVQTHRLRNHVGEEVDKRYATEPELAERIKSNLNVNSGVFGYRLTVTLHRMFVDSETRTPQSGNVPNLIHLHSNGKINLFELAGFDHNCDIFSKDGWRRSLPRTALKTWLGGGGGLIDTDPPEISRDTLKEYIDSQGAKGPPFRILAMSTAMLNSRIKAAQLKGRQLGLILSFDVKLTEVTDHQFINYKDKSINTLPIDCTKKQKAQPDYLICELGRFPDDENFICCDAAFNQTVKVANHVAALHQLCMPVAIGVFSYPDNRLSGFANNLIGTTTGSPLDLPNSNTSGVSFRAQIPEDVRKWVLIHELGHYFGLIHVDGFDRIMVSGKEDQGELITPWALPSFIFHGGPRFTYSEAKRVWNFILTNFPSQCLAPPIIL